MNYPLFSCFGVEVELMIVDATTLDVRPLADRILRNDEGVVSELEAGRLAWSNELVAHVVELKTNGPTPAIDGDLLATFCDDVQRINAVLAGHGARLLPTAMHPWMEPDSETVLWPHEHNAIYRAYDRIFGCRGHGWSNLQSLHINLPFANDDEFARLHAAIRLLLPLLPALAASSPLVEGRLTGVLDNRMVFYSTNSSRVPSLTGDVIPEPVGSREEYERSILEPMYADIGPYDPEGILRHEFLNSRGAIARFDRGAIEIRVLDSQECPKADLAIVAGVVAVLRCLVDAGGAVEVSQGSLVDLLGRTVRGGGAAVVDEARVLEALGLDSHRALSANEVWRRLIKRGIDRGFLASEPWTETLRLMIELGPLADRIRRSLAAEPSHEAVQEVYRRLAECLVVNELFEPVSAAAA